MPFRRAALLVALALPFVLTACDSTDAGGGDTFILDQQNPPRVEFTFRFDGGDLQAGVLNDVLSENSENLVTFIESKNFTVDDVVSVAIKNGTAEFRIEQPPLNAGVNGFDQVQVRLRPGGATSAGSVVATGSGFSSADDTVDLDVSASDLATAVQTGAFDALLQVDPSDLVLDTDYTVEVSFQVLIEVQ